MAAIGFIGRFGPPLFYCLVGCYCAAVWYLEQQPTSILGWGVLYELAPVVRGPVYAITHFLPLTMLQIVFLSTAIGVAGFAQFDRRWRIFSFFYSHLALLISLYAILAEPLPKSAMVGNRPGSGGLLYDTFDLLRQAGVFLTAKDMLGLMLFALILLSCLFWHFQTLLRIVHVRSKTEKKRQLNL